VAKSPPPQVSTSPRLLKTVVNYYSFPNRETDITQSP
jgi:hypothetical protein